MCSPQMDRGAASDWGFRCPHLLSEESQSFLDRFLKTCSLPARVRHVQRSCDCSCEILSVFHFRFIGNTLACRHVMSDSFCPSLQIH